MPYQDAKILNVKDMEVESHYGIIVMDCGVVQNSMSFQDRSWIIQKDLFVGARDSLPK